MSNKSKVSIVGAGGNVGSIVAYSIAMQGLSHEVILVDRDIDRAKGKALDMNQAASAVRTHSVVKAAESYEDVKDSSVVVITAGFPRKESNAISVHAYDTAETVVGQGTLFCEWEQQGLQADTLIIAVGGGGLISGAISWFGKTKKIVAVEPEKCPTLNVALENGKPTSVSVSGVAANALGAKLIGNICFNLSVQNEIESVLVSDSEIVEAQKLLWEKHRMLVEPAGAAALAAIISGKYQHSPNEKLAILICGANPTVAPDF
jgi:threonine dehydratase